MSCSVRIGVQIFTSSRPGRGGYDDILLYQLYVRVLFADVFC